MSMDDFSFALNTSPSTTVPAVDAEPMLLIDRASASTANTKSAEAKVALAHCPTPAPIRRPSTKPQSKHVAPAQPAPSNVCSPIVNIHLPAGINWLSASSASKFVNLMAPQAKALATPAAAGKTETQLERFGFKIGSWIEADISTRSTTLMLVMIALFLCFACAAFFLVKWTAKRRPDQASVCAALTVTVLAMLVIFTVYAFWPTSSEVRSAVDQALIQASERGEAHNTDIHARRGYTTRDSFGGPVVEPSVENPGKPEFGHTALLTEWPYIGWMVLLAIAIVLCFYQINRYLAFQRRPQTRRFPLPVAHIFRLQKDLGQVMSQFDAQNPARSIAMDDLLNAIDGLAYYLECGDEHPVFFQLRKSHEHTWMREDPELREELRIALIELDRELSDRHRLRPEVWRTAALRTLANVRRYIMVRCSPQA